MSHFTIPTTSYTKRRFGGRRARVLPERVTLTFINLGGEEMGQVTCDHFHAIGHAVRACPPVWPTVAETAIKIVYEDRVVWEYDPRPEDAYFTPGMGLSSLGIADGAVLTVVWC